MQVRACGVQLNQPVSGCPVTYELSCTYLHMCVRGGLCLQKADKRAKEAGMRLYGHAWVAIVLVCNWIMRAS